MAAVDPNHEIKAFADHCTSPTKRSLKFVLITTFYPPYNFGGDGNYVRMFAHALVRAGHQVDIIHDTDAFRALNNGPDPKPIKEPEGIHVHRLKSKWPKLACLATQQTSHPIVHGKEIKRILAKGQYDVIHYHNISLVGGLGILAYGKAIKLYTAHEHWLVCPTHVLWQHNKQVCEHRECIRCQLTYKRPIQFWRWTNLLEKKAAHVDAFCSLSQFSAAQHYKFGFTTQMKILPSFIPETFAASANENSVGSEQNDLQAYYLFVGRIEKIKGLQDVIPLFDQHVAAELWIAGSGSYEDTLKCLASGNSKIKFLGQKEPHELKSLYAHALALITPSLCYEVFPLVLLEAFREGTPVIARAQGPYPEIVQQSNAGLLFSTLEELKSALIGLLKDNNLRLEMSKAGHRAFRKYWCEQASMIQYFELISELARRKQLNHVLKASNSTIQFLKQDLTTDANGIPY